MKKFAVILAAIALSLSNSVAAKAEELPVPLKVQKAGSEVVIFNENPSGGVFRVLENGVARAEVSMGAYESAVIDERMTGDLSVERISLGAGDSLSSPEDIEIEMTRSLLWFTNHNLGSVSLSGVNLKQKDDIRRLSQGYSDRIGESWSKPSSQEATKFICTGIYGEGSTMSQKIEARKKAKIACESGEEQSAGRDISFWFQTKETKAPSFVGKVLITTKGLEQRVLSTLVSEGAVTLIEDGQEPPESSEPKSPTIKLSTPTLSSTLGTVTVSWDEKFTNLEGRDEPETGLLPRVDIYLSTSGDPLASESNKVGEQLWGGLAVLTSPTVETCETYDIALKGTFEGQTYVSDSSSIQVDSVFGCSGDSPNSAIDSGNDSSPSGGDLGYQSLNQEVLAASGMTVKVTQLDLEPRSGSTRLNLTYVMENNTSSSEVTEGSFKLFFTDGTSLNQFGFFNTLFPGDSNSRSYVFEWVGSKTPDLIEYDAGFFQDNPGNGLKWKVN